MSSTLQLSPKSTLALRRKAPPPLNVVPSSPLLFGSPNPADDNNHTKRIDRTWSLASIPIFLDEGDADDALSPGASDGYTFDSTPTTSTLDGGVGGGGLDEYSSGAISPSSVYLVHDSTLPSDVDQLDDDQVWLDAYVPSPARRNYRRLHTGSISSSVGPRTPGSFEMERRESAASSCSASSVDDQSSLSTMSGSSTSASSYDATPVKARLVRDDSCGTFGPPAGRDSLGVDDDADADAKSMFSISEYYGRSSEELDEVDLRSPSPSPDAPSRIREASSTLTITPTYRRARPSPPPLPTNSTPSRENIRDHHLRDHCTPSPSPLRPVKSAAQLSRSASPTPSSLSRELPLGSRSASSGSAFSFVSAMSSPTSSTSPSRHRPSNSFSGRSKSARNSMYVQQGKDIVIELLIDQEGFRAIRPQLSFTRYSPPSPVFRKHHGRSTSVGSSITMDRSSPTSRKVSGQADVAAAETGMFEFAMKKRQSWTFHHAALDRSPVLRRLTHADDDTRDHLSRQGDLVIKANGVYILRGSEDKGALEWTFEYEVDDKPGSKPAAGEKVLTPISFSCSPELLERSRGKKAGFLNIVKKSVASNLTSAKLEPPSLFTPPRPSCSSSSGSSASSISGTSPLASSPLSRTMDAIAKVVSPSSTGSRPSTPSRPTSSHSRQATATATPTSVDAASSPHAFGSADVSSTPSKHRKRAASLSARLRPFTPPSTSSEAAAVPLPVRPSPPRSISSDQPQSVVGRLPNAVPTFIPPSYPPPRRPGSAGRDVSSTLPTPSPPSVPFKDLPALPAVMVPRRLGVLKGGRLRPATADSAAPTKSGSFGERF